jgi:hypothetical protein
MTDIPKSAFDATDKIAASLMLTSDIGLVDADKTEIALIIAEPINKAIEKLEHIIEVYDDRIGKGFAANIFVTDLRELLAELKGEDNGRS